jgi:general secretion pathway protein N
MRPGSLALLGVAAYSAFLVALMPARWVAERALPGPGRIALHEVQGTIWHGSARASLGGYAGTFAVDRIDWRFLPSRLVRGRAAYDVGMRGAGFEARGEVGRSFGGWTLRDLAARADAALATVLAPWTGAWRPEGTVTVASPALDFAEPELRGEARIEWTGAATALSAVKPLGSYRADLAAEGRTARIAVTTQSGPLRVAGQGRLAFPSQLAFTGEARGDGPDAQALEPLLTLLGPRKPDGSHAIDWRTR